MLTCRGFGILFSAACLTVLAAAQAGAEPALPAPFQKYLDSPAFASRLSDALAMAKTTHFADCGTFKASAPRIVPLSQITLGDDGLPKSGQWKVSAAAEGCGKARIVNFFFVVGKDDKVFFVQAIPGTTRGDFRLQSDTVMYVLMAAVKQTKDCKGASISDTRFDSEDPLPDGKSAGGIALQFQKSWHETWTIDGCGHFYDVRVDYLLGPAGTTIMASDKNVTERPSPDAKPSDAAVQPAPK